MFKRAEVVMLPTNEKASYPELWLMHNKSQGLMYLKTATELDGIGQHLYFLSDEEIKEENFEELLKQGLYFESSNDLIKCITKYRIKTIGTYKKIIATTDKSLIIEGYDSSDEEAIVKLYLPQPSHSFLQKFVEEYNKGNVIEWVDVEYEQPCKFTKTRNGDYSCYCGMNTINGDKPINCLNNHNLQLKVNSKNEITIRKIKNSWTKKEHSLNLQYCVSTFAAERGLTPTSEKMKEVNDWVSNWIKENL